MICRTLFLTISQRVKMKKTGQKNRMCEQRPKVHFCGCGEMKRKERTQRWMWQKNLLKRFTSDDELDEKIMFYILHQWRSTKHNRNSCTITADIAFNFSNCCKHPLLPPSYWSVTSQLKLKCRHDRWGCHRLNERLLCFTRWSPSSCPSHPAPYS